MRIEPAKWRLRVWLALTLTIGVNAQPRVIRQPDRPLNLIVITTDDQRHDVIGALNRGATFTPGLDRLARRSLVFTNAHAVFALCSPSRAAILTGQYGSRNGVEFLDGALREPQRSVARLLRQRGYQTAVSGKWHLKTTPAEAGFDYAVTFYANGVWRGREVNKNGQILRPAELVDLFTAHESALFLRQRKQGQPFFLWHCTQLPHMDDKLTWPVSAESLALYDLLKMPLPATWNELTEHSGKPPSLVSARNRTQALQYGYDKPDRIRAHTREYRAAISDLDTALVPLWQAMDDEGLWENTLVIFLGDNGWMLGEHGLTSKVLAYKPSSQIPLMIAGPGIRPGHSGHLALNIDIAPTLLSLADAAIPAGTQGQPILLRQGKATRREAFVYEGLEGYGGTKPFLAAISSRWKLIHTWEDRAQVGQVAPFIELYDRHADPDEARNLAKKQRLQKTQAALARRIERHLADMIRTSR
ncbi:MAG: sulfatase-like hydrolase/transferase [Blastocatellia bacterium]